MPIHAIPRRNSDGSDEGNFFVEEDVYADEEFEREEEHARPKERKKPSPTLRLYGMPHEEAPVPAVEPTRRKGSSMSFRNNAPPKKERSFGLPQKKNGPGQNLPYMDEIARLLSLNDTLRIKIGALEGEVKDYRIVNRRQELAIQKMDKQQDDMPQVLHGLASELKGLRSIHAGCNARIANAEKSSQAHIDENIKLQNQVMKLNKILQARHLDDNEKQKKIIDKLRDDLESKDLMIEELRRRVKHLEAERKRDAREVRELKLQHLKDLRAVKEANDERDAENGHHATSYYALNGDVDHGVQTGHKAPHVPHASQAPHAPLLALAPHAPNMTHAPYTEELSPQTPSPLGDSKDSMSYVAEHKPALRPTILKESLPNVADKFKPMMMKPTMLYKPSLKPNFSVNRNDNAPPSVDASPSFELKDELIAPDVGPDSAIRDNSTSASAMSLTQEGNHAGDVDESNIRESFAEPEGGIAPAKQPGDDGLQLSSGSLSKNHDRRAAPFEDRNEASEPDSNDVKADDTMSKSYPSFLGDSFGQDAAGKENVGNSYAPSFSRKAEISYTGPSFLKPVESNTNESSYASASLFKSNKAESNFTAPSFLKSDNAESNYMGLPFLTGNIAESTDTTPSFLNSDDSSKAESSFTTPSFLKNNAPSESTYTTPSFLQSNAPTENQYISPSFLKADNNYTTPSFLKSDDSAYVAPSFLKDFASPKAPEPTSETNAPADDIYAPSFSKPTFGKVETRRQATAESYDFDFEEEVLA